jgi:hypothetical protein
MPILSGSIRPRRNFGYVLHQSNNEIFPIKHKYYLILPNYDEFTFFLFSQSNIKILVAGGCRWVCGRRRAFPRFPSSAWVKNGGSADGIALQERPHIHRHSHIIIGDVSRPRYFRRCWPDRYKANMKIYLFKYSEGQRSEGGRAPF